jgi:RNA polymerase sigma-70 factor (ECF subfamily)
MTLMPTGTESRGSIEPWIEEARGGSREALGRAIDRFRDYLLAVAGRELAPELKAKEGASDLVQEAFLQAHHEFHRFEGRSEGELRAWLRRLLRHKTAHTVRRYRGVGKRQLDREQSLDAGPSAGGTRLADELLADTASPGGQAVRREEEDALRAALGRLPERQRLAVLWRHHEGCGFEELGRRLGCTESAARKLWLRALQRLQHELEGAPPAGNAGP